MADGYTPDPADVELVATATERHHIDFDQSDADGNNPCVCFRWWDSAHMPGWDEHMAEVALSALAAAGRLTNGDALASIVREAACVLGETATDWQRGYADCSARVLAAVDSWATNRGPNG